MKKKGICLRMRLHWLILLLLTDIFFTFLVWLANPAALKSLALIILLFTVLSAALGFLIDRRKRKARLKALEHFLEKQGEYEEQELLAVTDRAWHAAMEEAFSLLKRERQQNCEKQQELLSYQEFIEAWTHEIKTPLSLSELVLANHREEMSDYVYRRMQHVQRMVGMDVERVLYYARLFAEHVDYKFERIFLPECVEEELAKFDGIAEEKSVTVQTDLAPVFIVSDRRVLLFMLSQIFSNAFKYTRRASPDSCPSGTGGLCPSGCTKETCGIVEVAVWEDEGEEKGGKETGKRKIHLAVRDNGEGAPAEDIPFLFDKGFTGIHPNRQNATGMGLYFVKKYAQILAVDVRVEERRDSGGGFGIELVFPVV